LGSCREVILDGQTGFLVRDVAHAVDILSRIPEIDREQCRQHVKNRFAIETMVRAYEQVYATIFERESKKNR
jgi:glycosyltransferase involved in cell wall biosynthesis